MIRFCTPVVDFGILLDALFVFEGLSIWQGTTFLRKLDISSDTGKADEDDDELERLWSETRQKETCPDMSEQFRLLIKSLIRKFWISYYKLKRKVVITFYRIVEKLEKLNNKLPVVSGILFSFTITLYYAGYLPEVLKTERTYLARGVAFYIWGRIALYLLLITVHKVLFHKTSVTIEEEIQEKSIQSVMHNRAD